MPPQRRSSSAAAVMLVALSFVGAAPAQGSKPVLPSASAPTSRPVDEGPRWQGLRPAQREALAPLERNWAGLDATSKQRWLAIVSRFPGIAPTERVRIQGQMADWARLTPAERGRARLQFEEAKQVPATDRRKRWDDYQALQPEERQQLAARALRTASAVDSRGLAAIPGRPNKSMNDAPQTKSNVVPNPALSAPPRSVTGTQVQAGPGATTKFLNKAPTPPAHQQTGMPKIAATPEFIDKSTLLPKRGAQAAGVGPVVPTPSATTPR